MSTWQSLLVDEALFGDVDTIEELPEILVVDVGELVDLSAGESDSVPVIALNPDFFLLAWAVHDLDAFWGGNALLLTLTHEVGEAEFVLGVADGVLDWEVSSDKPHLVAIALGNASNHVLDMAKEGAAASDELAVAEPAASQDLLRLLVPLDIQAKVAEITLELATRTGHSDNTGLDLDLDAILLYVEVSRVQNGTRHHKRPANPASQKVTNRIVLARLNANQYPSLDIMLLIHCIASP